MANVLRGRGMSWALALWSVYIVTWTVVTEPGRVQAAGWWLAGVACVALLRPTRPLAASDTELPSTALQADVELVPARQGGRDAAAP